MNKIIPDWLRSEIVLSGSRPWGKGGHSLQGSPGEGLDCGFGWVVSLICGVFGLDGLCLWLCLDWIGLWST